MPLSSVLKIGIYQDTQNRMRLSKALVENDLEYSQDFYAVHVYKATVLPVLVSRSGQGTRSGSESRARVWWGLEAVICDKLPIGSRVTPGAVKVVAGRCSPGGLWVGGGEGGQRESAYPRAVTTSTSWRERRTET